MAAIWQARVNGWVDQIIDHICNQPEPKPVSLLEVMDLLTISREQATVVVTLVKKIVQEAYGKTPSYRSLTEEEYHEGSSLLCGHCSGKNYFKICTHELLQWDCVHCGETN